MKTDTGVGFLHQKTRTINDMPQFKSSTSLACTKDGTKRFVKSVCDKAPKSVFWAHIIVYAP